MFTDDERKFAEIIDQPEYEAPAKQRARPKKAKSSAARDAGDAASPAKEPARRGRPPGAKNKLTLEREKVRKVLDRKKLAVKIKVMRKPKEILLESANYFWARAEFLSDHARALADEDASTAAIDAIMKEVALQLNYACKCAEQAAPYYDARVSAAPEDGDVIAYVARLPSPVADSAQWAQESDPHAVGKKRTQ